MTVKKKVLQYQTLASLHAYTRLLLLLLTLVVVVFTPVYAFKHPHQPDRFLAALGVLVLLIEGIVYGWAHYREWMEEAAEYGRICDRMDTSALSAEDVDKEIKHPMAGFPMHRNLANWIAEARWDGRAKRATFRMGLVLTVMVAIMIGGSLAIARFWPQDEPAHPESVANVKSHEPADSGAVVVPPKPIDSPTTEQFPSTAPLEHH